MIKILKSGLYSTIQDFGRNGYQAYGVPFSGAMDKQAAALANSLLGNLEEAPVIEMTMTGATLEFQVDTYICITGGDMSPKRNQKEVHLNKVLKVNKGDLLTFGALKSGFRSYVAVSGGINAEKIMASASMYKGITKSYMLSKGDVLFISGSNIEFMNQNASVKVDTSYLKSEEIYVFKGPEFELLSKQHQAQLFSKVFTVSKNNNRMAYQLKELFTNSLEPIITSNVIPGTVQLTPSGNLIILMRDCQTTGGYPRVLQLEDKAIDVLSQKLTGQTIQFKMRS